ncbi:hypothetical protein F4776DRAFT_409640 [Hypoxylon sp. NC0597]|nr:hypothetical protein F4776DRAFT_409640 [Hypoxylon sp. NC0597]
MNLNTGLRIARAHPRLLHHGSGSYVLAPLLANRISTKQLGPRTSRTASRRAASTASQTKEAPKSVSELVSSSRPSTPLSPSTTLNPPASTRPPPLELPTRDPGSSLFSYLFRLGKAYTSFYKSGLRAIFVNRRLLSHSPSAPPPSSSTLAASASASASTFPTRSDILLRARVRHDLSRLPLFGLLVLICGEFTPLIVLVFPRLTPYTCRIPKQTDVLRRSSEARRAASFRALQYGLSSDVSRAKPDSVVNGHICRSLGLTSALWDKIGLDGPFAGMRARRAVQRIAADDAMIREGGGVDALVDEEVVLACEERGIDVLGKSVDELRSRLEEWLRRTAPESRGDDAASKESAQKEAQDKVRMLLLEPDGRI